ncbi:TOBE domain-containing protein [Methanobacterium sp.]|uniref:TOBE domain-containing protein n=1 Tax=Methanobacterium sp. TaxID=2164 RepID=UPI003C7136EF
MSARNMINGTVENIVEGAVMAKIKVKIETPDVITAVITKEAVEDLKLKKGEKITAIVKSTEIMVAKD